MKVLTLAQKEQGRLMILNKTLKNTMNAKQAAEAMKLSLRHTRRLLAAYRKEGAQALAQIGNYALAIADFEKELDNNPLNINAYASRERVLSMCDQSREMFA